MAFLSWFRANSYCYVFSLQSGTVMSIMVLTALTITSLFHIFYFLVVTSSFRHYIVPFCVAYVYLIILFIGLLLAFIGAYTESTRWMTGACIITFVAVLYYIIIAILSFFVPMFDIFCLGARCPEHLWLQQSYWRTQEYDKHPRSMFIESKQSGPGISQTSKSKSEILQQFPFITKHPGTFIESSQQRRRRPTLGASRIRNNIIPEPRKVEVLQRTEVPGTMYPFFSPGRKIRKFSIQPYLKKGSENPSMSNYGNEGNADEGEQINQGGIDEEEGIEKDERQESSTDGRYIFSIVISCLFLIFYTGFICYTLFGFLAFTSELDRELYGYY